MEHHPVIRLGVYEPALNHLSQRRPYLEPQTPPKTVRAAVNLKAMSLDPMMHPGEILLTWCKTCANLDDVNFQSISLTTSVLTNSSREKTDSPYMMCYLFVATPWHPDADNVRDPYGKDVGSGAKICVNAVCPVSARLSATGVPIPGRSTLAGSAGT